MEILTMKLIMKAKLKLKRAAFATATQHEMISFPICVDDGALSRELVDDVNDSRCWDIHLDHIPY
ncbi:5216_t:CDS:2, partial [Racocetra fulgida]